MTFIQTFPTCVISLELKQGYYVVYKRSGCNTLIQSPYIRSCGLAYDFYKRLVALEMARIDELNKRVSV